MISVNARGLVLLFALAPIFGDRAAQGASPQTATETSSAVDSRRPRRRPRYKDLAKPKRPSGPRRRLNSPGWRPEVRLALEKLIDEKGRVSKKYNPEWPPVAVLVLDDVLAAHHAGEVAFLRMVERAEFRFSDAWWQRIPFEFRDRARRAHKRFSGRPEAVWAQDEDFLQWRKAMFASYDLQCRRDGRRACRVWLTQLLIGHTEGEAELYMRETLEEALSDPYATESIQGHAGDESAVRASRGLRRIPAMVELTEELLGEGFDVWVLSSSNQWIAEAITSRYGVDPSRVVGMRARIINRQVQLDIIDPIPEGVGMSEAVILFIGRDPALIVSAPEESPLLEYGKTKGTRVAIDRGDDKFRARAVDRGWLLQPELPVGPPEAPR